MKTAAASFALLVLTVPAFAASHAGKLESLACTTGPVAKTYGGQSWLVYSCVDGRSILVVSNHGDPPTSEYIMLSPAHGHVMVVGEGWGESGKGNAAFAGLKGMNIKQLERLVADTRRASQ